MIITAFFSNNGTPLVTPTDLPTIRIRRLDTQALVVTDLNMTEAGDGVFLFDFTLDVLLDYSFRCDGDPTISGQTTISERFSAGSFSGANTLSLTKVDEIYKDRGLDSVFPKTITEITEGISYDESVSGIDKEVRKVGNDTTITRV